MPKQPLWLLIATLLAALLMAGCEQETAQQVTEQPPPKVGIVTLEPQQVALTTELPGRTSAYRIAEVRPQVTGILQERRFKQGTQVNTGQVLYKIDPRPYRAASARAEADLARARAAVNAVRKRKKRFAKLLDNNHVSQQAYDDVTAELDQREAEVQVAKAELESAQIDLDYTSVEAPIDGKIGPTMMTTGALVTANQDQPLARITQLDPIYVDIQRSVTELHRLRDQLKRGALKKAAPGQARVTLLLEGGGEYPHPGKLVVSDVTVNNSTGSVTLRAVFPNPDNELLPGMYVRTRLSEGVRENAILAPQQGVSRNPQGQATALVVNDDNKVVQRQVKTDRAIGSFWLIDEGLKAGDRLIVSGLQKVEDGAEADPVPAEIPNKPETASSEQAQTVD